MRRLAAAVVAFTGVLGAQVAQQANSTYRTEADRKTVAQTLAAPTREETQRPGELIKTMGLMPGMTVADVGTGAGFPGLVLAIVNLRGVKEAGGVFTDLAGKARPDGGSAEKPVGLVYLALACRGAGAPQVERHCFSGDRGAVRYATVRRALELLLTAG